MSTMKQLTSKCQLPLTAAPGEMCKVGGSAWVVYRFNDHTQRWSSLYWAH